MQIFSEDVARERQNSESEIWDDIYFDLFPDMIGFKRCLSVEKQKQGVDRIVSFSDDREYTIEEKIRYKEYDDVALERWSSFEDKSLGWTLKDLKCDYVLYLFWYSGRFFLIPFQDLRKALIENLFEWENNYKILQTRNKGVRSIYTTVSVCVAIFVLKECIPSIRQGVVNRGNFQKGA